MLTPLSILSLDQGPKWQEPKETSAHEEEKAPEASHGRFHELLWLALAPLAGFSRRPAPSRSRA